MSATEFFASVDLPNSSGTVCVDSSYDGAVWVHWNTSSARVFSFLPVSTARELAAALIEAADATDEATREAESGVKL